MAARFEATAGGAVRARRRRAAGFSRKAEARAMNDLPKIVFSRTLEKVEWKNSRLIKGNAAEEIARLKEQPGRDMALLGSADLASSFTRHGLIDEYRIFVNPVVLSQGNRMFKDIKQRTHLKLLKATAMRSGVVVLDYQPRFESLPPSKEDS